MGIHSISVIPIHIEPFPDPKPYEKAALLPGLWLDGINSEIAIVGKQVPVDPTIREITQAIVLDYPVYAQGLLRRLGLSEKNEDALFNGASEDYDDAERLYSEHPLEMDIHEEDIRRLVIASLILAGAQVVVINRPVLAALNKDSNPVLHSAANARHVWRIPGDPREEPIDINNYVLPRLEMSAVSKYCELLEPYFRGVRWHSGRMAVALGAFLAYALGSNDGQGFLGLMTSFEALLSTTKSEITHQICERLAFMLDETEGGRYTIYKRMQELYDTRSRLVHGDIENKKGVITYHDLRLDAKMTIVPDADYFDLFTFCVRLFKAVFADPVLLSHLEKKNSSGLKEYYLRLIFRGSQVSDKPNAS